MKLVLQRVSEASVTVDGECVSSIGPGILALVGFGRMDSPSALPRTAQSILNMKLWPNAEGKAWKRSVLDTGGELLIVSQFTLYATVVKCSRLDFHHAMAPAEARELYSQLLAMLREAYDPSKVKDGVFGAMMDVKSTNDGPVTITLDNHERGNSMQGEETEGVK